MPPEQAHKRRERPDRRAIRRLRPRLDPLRDPHRVNRPSRRPDLRRDPAQGARGGHDRTPSSGSTPARDRGRGDRPRYRLASPPSPTTGPTHARAVAEPSPPTWLGVQERRSRPPSGSGAVAEARAIGERKPPTAPGFSPGRLRAGPGHVDRRAPGASYLQRQAGKPEPRRSTEGLIGEATGLLDPGPRRIPRMPPAGKDSPRRRPTGSEGWPPSPARQPPTGSPSPCGSRPRPDADAADRATASLLVRLVLRSPRPGQQDSGGRPGPMPLTPGLSEAARGSISAALPRGRGRAACVQGRDRRSVVIWRWQRRPRPWSAVQRGPSPPLRPGTKPAAQVATGRRPRPLAQSDLRARLVHESNEDRSPPGVACPWRATAKCRRAAGHQPLSCLAHSLSRSGRPGHGRPLAASELGRASLRGTSGSISPSPGCWSN